MVARWTPLLVAAGLLVTACGSSDDDTVLVLAASSLTDAFEDMEIAFERANPGVDIEMSFAGSSALRVQIEEGAPADVIAVANDQVMTELAGEGHVAMPEIFATNRLVIAAPADGSATVTGAESLGNAGLLVGLCTVEVPCGRYAADALAAVGIEPNVDTYESDVRSLTTKLAIGELDVGVVYQTDAAARSDDIVVIAPLDDADVRYPIAPLVDAPDAEMAALFVEFVFSAEGLTVMDAAGFGTP